MCIRDRSKGAIPPHLPESKEQNLIVIEAFLEAAKRYARGGYDVIVDGIIAVSYTHLGEHIYSSPAYYLQQNDVVYVEPNEVKARQSTVNGNNAVSYTHLSGRCTFGCDGFRHDDGIRGLPEAEREMPEYGIFLLAQSAYLI